MKNWELTRQKVVDQRALELPPAWVPRAATTHSTSEVNPSGVCQTGPARKLAGKICEAISSAKEMVVVSSFLFADAELEACLLSAARRGVSIYLMTASEHRLDREPREDSEFGQKCRADHERLLNSLAGWALIRSCAGFHAKAVLVDPKNPGPGFVLTANLTAEALERNEELAVKLQPAETSMLFEVIRWACWEMANHEMGKPGSFRDFKPLSMLPKPHIAGSIKAIIPGADSITSEALELISQANQEVVVSSFGWSGGHPVVEELCKRAREGLNVTILARVRPAAMPALLELRRCGAKVFGFPWLHAKAIWNDAGKGLVMSANLEPSPGKSTFELGIALEGKRAATLGQVLRGWSSASKLELVSSPALGGFTGTALLWQNNAFSPYCVKEEEVIDVGEIEAPSTELMESLQPPIPTAPGLPKPAHQLVYKGNIMPPMLKPKAQERLRPGKTKRDSFTPFNPPVFREPDGRVVVAITHREQLSHALRIKDEVKAAAIVVREEKRS